MPPDMATQLRKIGHANARQTLAGATNQFPLLRPLPYLRPLPFEIRRSFLS
jgi:hypothetical protein